MFYSVQSERNSVKAAAEKKPVQTIIARLQFEIESAQKLSWNLTNIGQLVREKLQGRIY